MQDQTTGCDAMSKFHKNSAEIVQYLSPDALFTTLCKWGFTEYEEGTYLLNDNISRHKRSAQILALVEAKGSQAYPQFLECLAEEREHLGHVYIVNLLEGNSCTSKEEEEEIRISKRIKMQARAHMKHIVKHINVDALAPHLYHHLLTDDEYTQLLSSGAPQTKKVSNLLSIVDTKGPTGYYKFAHCLVEESEHEGHKDILQKITSEGDLCPEQRKRKREDEDSVPAKRICLGPDQLRAQGTLCSKRYFECIRRIRKCHLGGDWGKADAIVDEYVQKGDKELHIALLLENCTGYITRQDKNTVLMTVERAMQLCNELPSSSDNKPFLVGRCKWVLAKLYRYTKEKDKALKYIQEAAEHQSSIASGEEDAALTTYCYAMILLEFYKNYKSSLDRDLKVIKDKFERAIDYASNPDYGLDVSHPRIRLAMLYLGSSPFQPGRNCESSSINKAKNSLEAVDIDALAPRTKCLFYYTKSDLVYSRSKDEAKVFAKHSLDVAMQHGFKTEKLSAQARLESIHVP